MNKDEILKIIEATLKSGSKTPGLFDLPKVMAIKSEIQSCTSLNDVLGLIEEHRTVISKVFGLSEGMIEEAVVKLKALES